MGGAATDEDPRLRAAWRTWLSALAVDPEAALAASLAYDALPAEGRDAWLDALEEDRADLGVPWVALYAPLLAVEPATLRRDRIVGALRENEGPLVADRAAGGSRPSLADIRALRGESSSGEHVCALVSPLYLEFVEVLVCRYRPGGGFISARRDAVRHVVDVLGRRMDSDRPLSCSVDGVPVLETPLGDVVEDLAHAILADRRQGRLPPDAVKAYAHLFVPELGSRSSLPPSSEPPSSGA